MNSIFKSAQGFHIDLSKIVAIGELITVHKGYYHFSVDIQLTDHPKEVSSYGAKIYYDNPDDYDEQVRKPLLEAWIKYNEQPISKLNQYLTNPDPLGQGSIPCTRGYPMPPTG